MNFFTIQLCTGLEDEDPNSATNPLPGTGTIGGVVDAGPGARAPGGPLGARTGPHLGTYKNHFESQFLTATG